MDGDVENISRSISFFF